MVTELSLAAVPRVEQWLWTGLNICGEPSTVPNSPREILFDVLECETL